MAELTPQQQRARVDALLARGRILQDAESVQARAFQCQKAEEQRHAAWVRRQNQLRDPAWKAKVLAEMRLVEEEKQAKREENALIAARLADYEAKLRARAAK